MRVLTSELLGDALSLESRMAPGNHKLADLGEVDAAMQEVFTKDQQYVLERISGVEAACVMRITQGVLPEDLDFTPTATEVKMFRSGVRKDLTLLEREAKANGVSLEAQVVIEEVGVLHLREEIRRTRVLANSIREMVTGFTKKDHRMLDAAYIRLQRYAARVGVL